MNVELNLRMPELIADDFPDVDLPRVHFAPMGFGNRITVFTIGEGPTEWQFVSRPHWLPLIRITEHPRERKGEPCTMSPMPALCDWSKL